MPAPRFFRFMDENAGPRRRTILFGGVGSGLLQGLTIAIIGMGLDEFSSTQEVSARVMLLFTISVVSYYWSFRQAMTASTGVAFEAVSDLQLSISDRLRRMNYPGFVRLEQSQVYAALMGNKDIVVEASRFLVSFISGAAMMFCAFIYAAFISLPGLMLILGILVLCGGVFVRMQSRTFALQELAAKSDERFLASLKDLLNGFIELKMNRQKSDDLYESGIRKLCFLAVAAKREVEKITIRGTAFFATFIFLPVGAAVFLLPRFTDVDSTELVKLIAVTLFSLSPLMGLVLFIPLVGKAQMTLDGLTAFSELIDAHKEPEPARPPKAPDFRRISLAKAGFSYPAPQGQTPFGLEIDEFHLNRGELVLLTGGNGSGKSTFMRILAGLLPLEKGEIMVDGEPTSQVGLADYRALFSVVFGDFHLFNALYGIPEPDMERIEALLRDMRLADKVRVTGRSFSTTELSSGQRKRLALICALLEDRPVLLFDEVAADFDHTFRHKFYTELLPRLRDEGRTILAISHDDRYFGVADRVLLMRDGVFEPAGAPGPVPGTPGHGGLK